MPRVTLALWVKAGAVVLIAAGVLSLARQRLSRPPWPALPAHEFRLLPDVGGGLAEVACTVNSARKSALRNAATISGVVNSLGANTRFYLLTNDRDAFWLASNPDPGRVDFVDLRPDGVFTIWPQDPFLVLRKSDDHDQLRLLVSAEFGRADDGEIPGNLAEATGAEHLASSLHFDGGNIISDQEFVFIGGDTIYANALKFDVRPELVVRRFEAELGRPVITVGPVPQPVGHLDMMMTPLGNRRILLADPGRGADIVQDLIERQPEVIAAFEAACTESFFGHPDIRELTDADGNRMRPPDLREKSREAVERSRLLAVELDRLAAELESLEYEVHRVAYLDVAPPATEQLPSESGRGASSHRKERPARGPHYPTISYNNVLLDEREGERIVFLPRYGLAALDEAAARKWTDLGFTVHPVEDLVISAIYGGSLRCCVKVLRRAR